MFRCGECNKAESRPAAEYFRLDQAVKQLAKEKKNITPTEVAKWCARRDEELQLGGKQIREAVRRRRIKRGALVRKKRRALITWNDEWDQLVREHSDPDSGLLAFVHVPRSWCISSWVALVPPFFQQLETLGIYFKSGLSAFPGKFLDFVRILADSTCCSFIPAPSSFLLVSALVIINSVIFKVI